MRDRQNKKSWTSMAVLVAIFLATAFFFVPKARSETRSFVEKFNRSGVVNETGSMEESSSPDWWVGSGGKMLIQKGAGQTLQKKLSKSSNWRKLYKKTNSADTDDGKHPQNIFRLVTRTKWQNLSQQAFFKIKKLNLSDSDNWNESNGLLFFNRYQDSDNLYYTGVRVDGYAVIKKKLNGEYFTLAYNKFFGGKKYNRKSRPNLLPSKKSIGLKSEIRNTEDGKVEIKLFVANGRKGKWVLAASAVDENNIISSEGYGGIRTDFMDVEFDKYKITEL